MKAVTSALVLILMLPFVQLLVQLSRAWFAPEGRQARPLKRPEKPSKNKHLTKVLITDPSQERPEAPPPA